MKNYIDKDCKECKGYGYYPSTIKVGNENPPKLMYAPCTSCNGEYRELVERY